MHKDEFIGKTIGKPWKNRSCNFDEMDCWGLVCLYFLSVHGISVGHSVAYSCNDEFSKCFGDEVRYWLMSNEPSEGGIFVAYVGANPVHVGLIINGSAYHSRAESSHVRFDKIRTIERVFTKVEYYKYAFN